MDTQKIKKAAGFVVPSALVVGIVTAYLCKSILA